LVVCEKCDGVPRTFLVKFDTHRKDLSDRSGSFQNSTARTSPAKCQGGGGTKAATPKGERGAVNPLSNPSSHHRQPISALFERELLALASIPTLGQTYDDLVVRARPVFMRSRLNRATSLSPRCSAPFLRGKSDNGAESYKLRHFATSARCSQRVSRPA
jgi:hypothetical protein